jgi:hypothetical protein
MFVVLPSVAGSRRAKHPSFLTQNKSLLTAKSRGSLPELLIK